MMADQHNELLEMIMRDCAQRNPWYPSEFARATGVNRDALDDCLDQLRINGLLQLTPWVQGQGQGYQPTAHGVEVLRQPRLLGRLRMGDIPVAPKEAPVVPSHQHALRGLRGEQMRAALLDDSRPLATQFLLAVNVGWFLVGLLMFVLRYKGQITDYIGGGMLGPVRDDAALVLTYRDCGWLDLFDVVERQQWWRLLSYAFLHGGILHLGMNMYGLFVLGPLLEKMWGRAAFVAIYLAACVGGGGAALLFAPGNPLVGASGALCGVLGSMATWLYLSRSYLPPHIVGAWRNNIIQNVVLLGIISFLPNVSLACHTGGGLTGAVVAAPLWLARFGVGSQRVLGWLATFALIGVSLAVMYPRVMAYQDSDELHRFAQMDDQLQQLRRQLLGQEEEPEKELSKADEQLKLQLNRAEEVADDINIMATKQVLQVKPNSVDAATAKERSQAIRKLQMKLLKCINDLGNTDRASPPWRRAAEKGKVWFAAELTYCAKLIEACDAGLRMTTEERRLLIDNAQRLGDLRSAFKNAYKQADR
jgi:membrane associated rhomboid family serine protease